MQQYKDCDGNNDGYYLTMLKPGKGIVSDEEWSLIENLIQEYRMVKRGQTSQEFALKVLNRIKENCTPEATELIKQMA